MCVRVWLLCVCGPVCVAVSVCLRVRVCTSCACGHGVYRNSEVVPVSPLPHALSSQAAKFLQKALVGARKHGLKALEGETYGLLGVSGTLGGNYAAARMFLEHRRELASRQADKASESAALQELSQLSFLEGDTTSAVSALDKSVALLPDGDLRTYAESYTKLGSAASRSGEYADAAHCFRAALDIDAPVSNEVDEATRVMLGVAEAHRQLHIHMAAVQSSMEE